MACWCVDMSLIPPTTAPVLTEEAKGLREGDGFVEDFFIVRKETESELPITFSIKVTDEIAKIGTIATCYRQLQIEASYILTMLLCLCV